MIVRLQILHVVIFLLTVNKSVQNYQSCSDKVPCGSNQCCLRKDANDTSPKCAPLAEKGARCTDPLVIFVRGAPTTVPKVFTGFCQCSTGLRCTGNDIKYCTESMAVH